MGPFAPTIRGIIDALDDPSLIVDGAVVRFANPAAARMLGARIEGRDVRLAIRHPQALEKILAHQSAELDVIGIADPGRSWRLIVRRLGDDSALVRMIDRSDSVSAERMRVDFVANASHELRTPLSTILGYSETLAEDAGLEPALRSKFGATIRDEAARMLRIVEDLMSLSRIEADRFIAPDEIVSLAEVIETAIANVTAGGRAADCEFVVRIADDLPTVRGDQAQLVQVFDNLIGNAVRYGGGTQRPTVELSAARNGRLASVTVTDHGPGIAREHLPRLTERFYRVDAARSRESGGTGLGLAIVKHIVERHRGTLEIRSVVGEGTSVTVRLPTAA